MKSEFVNQLLIKLQPNRKVDFKLLNMSGAGVGFGRVLVPICLLLVQLDYTLGYNTTSAHCLPVLVATNKMEKKLVTHTLLDTTGSMRYREPQEDFYVTVV